MKKNIVLLLMLVVCISLFAGCQPLDSASQHRAESSLPQHMGEDTTENTDETVPEIIGLTVSNIYDYLIFTVKIEDVEIENAYTYKKGSGSATVKVSSKKRADYEDVKITFSLETSSSGWGTQQGREIEVSYDGSAEQSYKLYSYIHDYVSSNPSYKVVVTAVTGTVTVG